MIRTTRTGLSKRDQEEFTRNTVEAALESERYVVWMFRVENGTLYKDHSMLHFPEGDYTAVMEYVRNTVTDFVKPKAKDTGNGRMDESNAIPNTEGTDKGDGNGQPEQAE